MRRGAHRACPGSPWLPPWRSCSPEGSGGRSTRKVGNRRRSKNLPSQPRRRPRPWPRSQHRLRSLRWLQRLQLLLQAQHRLRLQHRHRARSRFRSCPSRRHVRKPGRRRSPRRPGNRSRQSLNLHQHRLLGCRSRFRPRRPRLLRSRCPSPLPLRYHRPSRLQYLRRTPLSTPDSSSCLIPPFQPMPKEPGSPTSWSPWW